MPGALLVTTDPLPAAPGEDQHVGLALANSRFVAPQRNATAAVVDLLASPDRATRWLTEHALATPDVELREYCTDLLTALRVPVREVFQACVSGVPPTAGSVAALNHALALTPTVRTLAWSGDDGFSRNPLHPTTRQVEHALATIAEDVAELLAGPEAELLAVCGAEPCDRFLLRTHARRSWCSTRCGDRVRAARAYARRGQTAR